MSRNGKRTRVVIMGAAGRDFHNFNVVYRDSTDHEVVAFTAAQIPGIASRRYPAVLAGTLYPRGVPIEDEANLERICRDKQVDEVVFAYSDVPHEHVMHRASAVLATGADFVLLGPARTMLRAEIPVVSVCAVRTGCGKSQVTRWLASRIRDRGLRVGVVRHPMPYGDLSQQTAQRFATRDDLDKAECTIEEREEYEPHLVAGNIVYAGVDYARILAQAQAESDLLLWDGGNNDFSFYEPDLQIVLVDPLRPGDETTHHPGESVLRMADIAVVAKSNSAPKENVEQMKRNVALVNPAAKVVLGASLVRLETGQSLHGRRVLVVEDGPTLTHGGMAYGAAYVAATEAGVSEIVDPRDYAAGDIGRTYEEYPHLGKVLPALGYYPAQLKALAQTIDAADADVVISGTPIDLAALIDVNKPIVRARYDYGELDEPGLGDLVDEFLDTVRTRPAQ